MKTCQNCGAQFDDSKNYCIYCGEPLGDQKNEKDTAPEANSFRIDRHYSKEADDTGGADKTILGCGLFLLIVCVLFVIMAFVE